MKKKQSIHGKDIPILVFLKQKIWIKLERVCEWERERVRGEKVFAKRKTIGADGEDESGHHNTAQHCEQSF